MENIYSRPDIQLQRGKRNIKREQQQWIRIGISISNTLRRYGFLFIACYVSFYYVMYSAVTPDNRRHVRHNALEIDKILNSNEASSIVQLCSAIAADAPLNFRIYFQITENDKNEPAGRSIDPIVESSLQHSPSFAFFAFSCLCASAIVIPRNSFTSTDFHSIRSDRCGSNGNEAKNDAKSDATMMILFTVNTYALTHCTQMPTDRRNERTIELMNTFGPPTSDEKSKHLSCSFVTMAVFTFSNIFGWSILAIRRNCVLP